jgi:hypothetical protein
MVSIVTELGFSQNQKKFQVLVSFAILFPLAPSL